MAAMALTIREPEDDDFADVAAITNHYIATTAIHFGYQPVTADELRAAWRDGRDRYPWRIATAGGAVVGYAKAGPWRARDAYQWTAELGVYVAADRQREGIGRALYAAVIDAARVAGFHSVLGGITLPNPASVALHLALGFAHVGTVRDAGWKLGGWHAVAFYQRVLAASDAPPT